MRKIALLIIAVCSSVWGTVSSTAQTAHFLVPFTDLGLRSNIVRSVTLTPIARTLDTAGVIRLPDPITYGVGAHPEMTNGSVTFSNRLTGYAMRFDLSTAYSVYSYTSCVPTNVTGLVNVTDYGGVIVGMVSGIVNPFAFFNPQLNAQFSNSVAAIVAANIPNGIVTNGTQTIQLGSDPTSQVRLNWAAGSGPFTLITNSALLGAAEIVFPVRVESTAFLGDGSALTGLPPVNIASNTPNGRALNGLIGAFTNATLTTSGSTTGTVSIANNVLSMTIGSSNAPAAQTNFPFAAMANVLQSQVTTNSLLGNPNSAHWGGIGGTYFTATAYKNGGEYIFNQQSNSLGNGLAYNFAMPPGITNMSVSFSMRSLNGPASLYIQLDENNNNIGQRQISLVTNSYTNLTLTTSASDFLSNQTNCSIKFLVGSFPFCVSNFVFTIQTVNPDPIFSGNWKRIEVLPRNVVSGNFISSYVNDKKGTAPIWVENFTAASCGNKAYTEFYTDADSVNLELSVVNNTINGAAYPNTIYVNGAFYTNIMTPVTYQNTYIMTNLYLGNAGVTKTVRVYNSEGESSAFPNYCRAILLPTTNLFGFTTAQTKRKIFVVGDSIIAGNRSYGDQSQDIWNIVGSHMDAEIVRNTLGGASLNKLWQTNSTKKAFLHALNMSKPDALWIALGVNDKANNYYGTGTNLFQQDYSNLLATVHYQFPSLQVYVQNLLYTTDTNATGGYTIPQYRDAITAEATRAANWCVLMDASTWLVAADLEDNYHPSMIASGKLAIPIVANLSTNTIVVRP